ncbi:MAG: tail fiber domain-containing protein [Phycisphaerales bacterium]|nr:tail fiber domain-containing protein [Phycisphaerales bacterium]
MKKNIQPLDGALARMLALQGVTFEYHDPAKIQERPGVQIGMIAQQVESVFPDWVEVASDGYRRLTFRGFEALTVESIRELQSLQNAQLSALRAENASLKERLEKIEAMLASR